MFKPSRKDAKLHHANCEPRTELDRIRGGLGVRRELVGRTKFCVRAGAAAERIPVIGGTKRIHLDRVEQLKPDLVIASKEENTREDVEACRAFTDVLVTDVRTIPML